jgi:hypothetical protein
MRKQTTLILGLIALSGATAIQAQDVAIQGFSGGYSTGGNGATAGWEFQANSAITVTQLGFYQPDLAVPTPVGLWTSGGALLGQVIVTGGSTLFNNFLYTPLSSGIPLVAGQDYFVGALQTDETVLGSTTGLTTAPEVTYLQDAFVYTGGLSVPVNTYAPQEAGYFGPNFEFTSGGAVPDGGATMMLLGMGLAAVSFVKRKIS